MKTAYRLVAALLAASLLVGGTSVVFAKGGKAATHHAFAYGQVSNLSTSSFTLTAMRKKASSTASPKVVQVTFSAATKEKARKGTTGALANSEYAFVVGTMGTSGLTAARVLYASKAFNGHRLIRRFRARHIANHIARRLLHRHTATGTVNATSTTATSLVITTAKGKTRTFAINSQTKYSVNKKISTVAPSFTSGEKVRVRFARDATTKAITARVITVLSSGTSQP